MSELPARVEGELEDHDAFERIEAPAARPVGRDVDVAYDLATTVFDVAVTADEAGAGRGGDGAGRVRIRIVVELPSLSAAVADETVAPVVEEGWFETLERRLGDVFDVASTETDDDPTVERADDRVVVRLEYVARDAAEGVVDAKSLVEYVEGTYAQGVIPGYEYRGPAATLLSNARERGQNAAGAPGDEPEGRDGPPL